MLSPKACASPYVKEEVDYAVKFDTPIIPLMIHPVTKTDMDKLGVADLNYINFTHPDTRAAWDHLLGKDAEPDQKTLPLPLIYRMRYMFGMLVVAAILMMASFAFFGMGYPF